MSQKTINALFLLLFIAIIMDLIYKRKFQSSLLQQALDNEELRLKNDHMTLALAMHEQQHLALPQPEKPRNMIGFKNTNHTE